jgi:hypothetical protein
VTGKAWSPDLGEQPQNYVVIPTQLSTSSKPASRKITSSWSGPLRTLCFSLTDPLFDGRTEIGRHLKENVDA